MKIGDAILIGTMLGDEAMVTTSSGSGNNNGSDHSLLPCSSMDSPSNFLKCLYDDAFHEGAAAGPSQVNGRSEPGDLDGPGLLAIKTEPGANASSHSLVPPPVSHSHSMQFQSYNGVYSNGGPPQSYAVPPHYSGVSYFPADSSTPGPGPVYYKQNGFDRKISDPGPIYETLNPHQLTAHAIPTTPLSAGPTIDYASLLTSRFDLKGIVKLV